MAEIWIEAIGLFAGLLGIVAWLPQIKEVWVLKKHEGISIPTFVVVTIALCLWLIYGILIHSIAMIVANILTLLAINSMLIGVIKLRKQEING
ncbi:MAG: SemiSWEET family sugar transporter [Candidatus Poseidoniaceae archaeon]